MRSIILCLFAILFFNSSNPLTSKNNINPPLWIIGKWSNAAVSNTGNIDTFIFHKHNIIFSQGLFPKKKQVDFAKEYSIFKVSEIMDSIRYNIKLSSGNKTLEYEFVKTKIGSNNQNVLSYSVKENNKVIRQHSDSINRVLFIKK